MRYPASWKTDTTVQDGVWYRYFLGPPAGPERKPSVSVTLLAGPLPGTLDEYAQTYLAGNPVASTRDEARPGAAGRSYRFASADGATRYALLLLQAPPAPWNAGTGPTAGTARVYGLYAQAAAASFVQDQPLIEDMFASVALERPELYHELSEPRAGLSLRLPPSWKETRHFSGGETTLYQYTSPALAADHGQTVHASLTITVEPAPDGLDAFYQGARGKLGDSFQLLTHQPWRGGWVDFMKVETPVAESRVKRFYVVQGGRGYTLAFDAREDVFARVSRWCDLIASSLKVEGQ